MHLLVFADAPNGGPGGLRVRVRWLKRLGNERVQRRHVVEALMERRPVNVLNAAVVKNHHHVHLRKKGQVVRGDDARLHVERVNSPIKRVSFK